MSLRMTDEQRQVVETVHGDLCVAAGAGSGKTTVLAHRFAQALTSHGDWEGAPVDAVLTMTFTNKAAAEIAERVRRVTAATVSTEMSRSVDTAWISTIHSFCSRLVRRHALEVGADPYFATADQVTARALQTEALDLAASEMLAAHPDEAGQLIEAFGLDRLRTLVTTSVDQARAMGLDPTLLEMPNEGSSLQPRVQAALRRASELREALRDVGQTDAVKRDCAALDAYVAALRDWDGETSASTEALIAIEGGLKVSCRSATDERQALRSARETLSVTLEAVTRRPLTDSLARLMRDYSREYAAAKRGRGLLDFEDLQELAVKLFEARPDIARRYRSQFRMIMVDEFQDTNRLQMRVIEPLRSDDLCVVGDLRQSIYGWRYADVDIFGELSRQMPQRQLSSNFRSHPSILAFVNGLFSEGHLFGPEFMRLNPRDAAELDPEHPRVECLFVNKQGVKRADALAAEAGWVADRVEGLIADGHNGAEMAVLLRNSTGAAEFARALEARGIATVVTAGQSLFDALEVLEIVALLRAIAVPLDDEALLSVLSGRIVALTDEALCAVRRSAEGSLWSGLETVATSPAAPALADADLDSLRHAHVTLRRLNEEQGLRRLPELLMEACEAFDYDLTLHALGPSGVRAWANVLKLVRQAEAFETAEGNDVAAFVAHLEERGELNVDTPAAADLGDGAVRIMTVHSSKGLEFPIVFVADLGTPKERSSGSTLVDSVISDGQARPVVGLKFPKLCGEARTALYQDLEPDQVRREREEQKRVLYVACTRAKEMLFVSGAVALGKDAQAERGIMDWIREAVPPGLVPDEGASVVELYDTPVRLTTLDPEELIEPAIEPDPGQPEQPVFAHIPCAAAPASPVLQPKTLSYSSIDLFRKCPLAFHARYELGLRSIDLAEGVVPTRIGSAAHDALQALQLGTWDRRKAEAVCLRHGLDAGQQQQVAAAVDAFAGSELAQRLAAADRVITECPVLHPLGDMVLTGSIDAIAWSGTTALVVDYKTGKSPDQAPEREASHELQARCYALPALAAGAETVEVAFAFVEAGMQTKTYRFDRSDRETLEAEFAQITAEIASGERPHLSAFEAQLCTDCVASGGICPVRQPSRAAKGGAEKHRDERSA